MVERAYIGVGSNLGDRLGHCVAAVHALNRLDGTKVMGVSAWYETEPVGQFEQPVLLPSVPTSKHPSGQLSSAPMAQSWFLNGVVGVETQLEPRALLDACIAIERERGRERQGPKGPRTLDLDLLLYGDRVLNEPGLTVPHPRLAERAFVLIPLSDIAGKTVHPGLNVTIAALRARLEDHHIVRRYEPGGISATGTSDS